MTDTIEPRDTIDPSPLRRALEAFDLIYRDPVGAARASTEVLKDPRSTDHADAVAHWSLARVHHDSGRIEEALEEFSAALRDAERAGLVDEQAQIRIGSSLTLAISGDDAAAMNQLALAEPFVSGRDLGRLFTNRAMVLTMAGHAAAAVEDYDRALPLLREDGDDLAQTRLLVNRGVALMQLGRTSEAQRDLRRAVALAESGEQTLLVAMAAHNLGYLDFLLGQMPSALGAFAQARTSYEAMGSLGRINAALDADECTVLLAAGFADEACDIAERLIVAARNDGNVLQLAEALLLQARALMALGDSGAAFSAAEEATRRFTETGRPPWAAVAEYVGAIASAAGDPHAALTRLRSAAATLARLGWRAEAAEVQLHIGELALRVGDRAGARAALEAAAMSRRAASGRLRAASWHATALLHVLEDRPAQARRAIVAGLRAVDEHRATLGASDLRARASADGVELATLGVRLALAAGRPTAVFSAAERWRAGALAGRATAVAGEAEIDHDLAELRRLERVAMVGDADHVEPVGDEIADHTATSAELARIERRITRATRLAPGDPRAVAGRLDVPALRSLLGGHTLVEYIEVDGRLYATVVTSRGVRLVELAALDAVRASSDHLGFALRRMAGLAAGHPRAATVIAAFRQTAGELDAMLVAPLRLAPGQVVIVPTGELHSVPWSAFAHLQHRAGLTVAPSAAWWISVEGGASAVPARTPALLVHGPDLPNAPIELDAIRSIDSGAVALGGEEATVERVLAAMADADLVHIAAHGRFRADNPMFSSLQLADGSLYVHDLQRLRRTPSTVVLTACSAGRSGVYSGDELLGTAVALLSLGVHSVIAPLLAVRDDSTAAFAVALHRELATGRHPSAALAAATAEAVESGDPGLVATAAAFQCIGKRE